MRTDASGQEAECAEVSFIRELFEPVFSPTGFAALMAPEAGAARSPITHGSALVAFERSRLALAPLISSRRKYWLPRLDMPPNRFLPPVEFWRGTRPSHAANSRPLRIFHISVLNCCKSSAHRAAEALLSLISRPPPRLRMA